MTDVPHQQSCAAVAPELVAVRVVIRAGIGGFLVVALLAISALAYWRDEPGFLRCLHGAPGHGMDDLPPLGIEGDRVEAPVHRHVQFGVVGR